MSFWSSTSQNLMNGIIKEMVNIVKLTQVPNATQLFGFFTIWKWESTNYLCSDIFLDEIKRMSLCFFLANLLTDFFSIQGYIRVSDQCFKSLVIKSSTMHQNDLQFKTDVNNTIHTYTCESSELSWYLPFHFSTLEQFEVIFCRISFAKFLTSNIKTLHSHIRYFLKM